VAVVVSGDFVAPPADLAVGAEEAVVDVVPQEDFVIDPDLSPGGAPGEVVPVLDVVDALDHAAADVAPRSRLGQDGEVAAVGGALEEYVGDAGVVELVHPPRRVHRCPLAVQVHVPPVLVGVEVHAAAAAALQPHVLPVGEEVHLHALTQGRGGAEARGGGRDDLPGAAGKVAEEQSGAGVCCGGYLLGARAERGGAFQGGARRRFRCFAAACRCQLARAARQLGQHVGVPFSSVVSSRLTLVVL
jgi:hypothetical protein